MLLVAPAIILIASDGLLDEFASEHLAAQDIGFVFGRNLAEVSRNH